MEIPQHDPEKERLQQLLTQNHIDTSGWGAGSAKTLEHLLKEVQEGESTLIVEDGRLVRVLEALDIKVRCTLPDGTTKELYEDRQEFTDGRIRRRDQLTGSLGEKIKSGETPNSDSVRRALAEELGFEVDDGHINMDDIRSEERETMSYPGLLTRYTFYAYGVDLPQDLYVAGGYSEQQPDKTTYFCWK